MKKQKVVSPPPEVEIEPDLTTPADIFNFYKQIIDSDFQQNILSYLKNLNT